MESKFELNINKYIDWHELYSEEIEISEDSCLYEEDTETIKIINQFNGDRGLDLMPSECSITEQGQLLLFFSETGGQNESDTQGWSRDYTFVLDKDFFIVSAYYSQG